MDIDNGCTIIKIILTVKIFAKMFQEETIGKQNANTILQILNDFVEKKSHYVVLIDYENFWSNVVN